MTVVTYDSNIGGFGAGQTSIQFTRADGSVGRIYIGNAYDLLDGEIAELQQYAIFVPGGTPVAVVEPDPFEHVTQAQLETRLSLVVGSSSGATIVLPDGGDAVVVSTS